MNDAIMRPEVEQGDGDIICDKLSESDQRSLVFHILYTADAFDYQTSLESIVDNFNRGFGIVVPTDSDVFYQANRIIQDRAELDTYLQPLLANWRSDRLGTCTRLILRLGTWEIRQKKVDAALLINEAIELAKCFAERDAFKFVNGILDEVARQEGYIPVKQDIKEGEPALT